MTTSQTRKFLTASMLLAMSMGGISCAAADRAEPGDGLVRNTVVVERPAPVLSALPDNHVRVVHGSRTYYLVDGTFYLREPRGFVVTTLVAGVRVSSLPRGATVVRRNGRVTYRYNGIRYRKSGRFFIVV